MFDVGQIINALYFHDHTLELDQPVP